MRDSKYKLHGPYGLWLNSNLPHQTKYYSIVTHRASICDLRSSHSTNASPAKSSTSSSQVEVKYCS